MISAEQAYQTALEVQKKKCESFLSKDTLSMVLSEINDKAAQGKCHGSITMSATTMTSDMFDFDIVRQFLQVYGYKVIVDRVNNKQVQLSIYWYPHKNDDL